MRFSGPAFLLASLLAISACAIRTTTYSDPITRLHSPNPEDRRIAADELRGRTGPSREAIPYLFDALAHESDPAAYGAILISLGSSGVAQAKPIIDARLRDSTGAIHTAAVYADRYWLARNGIPLRNAGGVHIVIYPHPHKKRPDPPLPPGPTPEPHPIPDPHQQPEPVPQPEPHPQPSTQPESLPETDACKQFAAICAADPFDEPRCQRELATADPATLEAWATCVNASTESCQKAYDTCTAKFAAHRP